MFVELNSLQILHWSYTMTYFRNETFAQDLSQVSYSSHIVVHDTSGYSLLIKKLAEK